MRRIDRTTLRGLGVALIAGAFVITAYLAATTDWTGDELLQNLLVTLLPVWIPGVACLAAHFLVRE